MQNDEIGVSGDALARRLAVPDALRNRWPWAAPAGQEAGSRGRQTQSVVSGCTDASPGTLTACLTDVMRVSRGETSAFRTPEGKTRPMDNQRRPSDSAMREKRVVSNSIVGGVARGLGPWVRSHCGQLESN